MNKTVWFSRNRWSCNISKLKGLHCNHINQLIKNNIEDIKKIAGNYNWACEDFSTYNKGTCHREYKIIASSREGSWVDSTGKSPAEAFWNFYPARCLMLNDGEITLK